MNAARKNPPRYFYGDLKLRYTLKEQTVVLYSHKDVMAAVRRAAVDQGWAHRLPFNDELVDSTACLTTVQLNNKVEALIRKYH